MLIFYFFKQFRSPEEYAYNLQTEAIDVFSMGNIFYYLLTDKEPYANLREEKSGDHIKEMIMNGTRPELTGDKILAHMDDPSATALIEAMNMCHVYDYQERENSSTVRDFLVERMKEIKEKLLRN